jgi:hypothetical protein
LTACPIGFVTARSIGFVTRSIEFTVLGLRRDADFDREPAEAVLRLRRVALAFVERLPERPFELALVERALERPEALALADRPFELALVWRPLERPLELAFAEPRAVALLRVLAAEFRFDAFSLPA